MMVCRMEAEIEVNGRDNNKKRLKRRDKGPREGGTVGSAVFSFGSPALDIEVATDATKD